MDAAVTSAADRTSVVGEPSGSGNGALDGSTPAPGPSAWERIRARPAALGIATGLLFFALAVWANSELLDVQFAVWGDTAANSLLIDEALRGRLLVGHYSRAGFSHPGPAFLYVQAAGEVVFHRWLGWSASPYGGWVLGIAALNAVLIGWVTAIAARLTRSWICGAALAAMTMLLAAWEPALLVNDWGPAVIVVPFLLLLIAGIAAGAGRSWALPAFTVAIGLMVHGHLSSLLFVAGAVGVVLALHWLWRRSAPTDSPTIERKQWAVAGVIGAFFALPVALHIATDWPGELGAYWGYARRNAGRSSGSLDEVVEFVSSSLLHGPAQVLALLFACGVVAALLVSVGRPSRHHEAVDHDRRRLLVAASVIVSTQALLFVVYSWRTVDDLSLTYLGWFGMAIPVVVLWTGFAVTLTWLGNRRGDLVRRTVGVSAVAAIVVICIPTVELSNPNRGMPELNSAVPAVVPTPTRLEFEQESWPAALGLLAEVRRAGGVICVEDAQWSFMVTDDLICEADDAGRTMWVTSAEAPDVTGPELFREGQLLLVTPAAAAG